MGQERICFSFPLLNTFSNSIIPLIYLFYFMTKLVFYNTVHFTSVLNVVGVTCVPKVSKVTTVEKIIRIF